MGSRLARYGAWLACCLSRGPRSPLGEGDVELLAEEMGEQSYAGGTFVFGQGDPAARVHVVRTKFVELSRTIKGRRVILQVLRPGDVFGDVPVFSTIAGSISSTAAAWPRCSSRPTPGRPRLTP